MAHKYKAAISPGNPPKGTLKCVASFKDHAGGRWEFVGTVPSTAGHIMMSLCATNGERQSITTGLDDGIKLAFHGGGAI